MMILQNIKNLLRSEIIQVAGCTEPASVAFAFLTARRHLKRPFDPLTARANLTASSEVLRNASTAVVPFLNLRGLRAVVAAGLSSRTDQFNLFPSVDRRRATSLLKRRGWLATKQLGGRKGVYVKAVLSTPEESVSVVIQGHHDELRSVSRSGRVLFRAPPSRARAISMPEIMAAALKRDRGLEAIARDFLIRQVRGRPGQALPQRVAALVRARMMGSPAPIMTIVGSGNHGIFLGVPLYDLYREHGARILPAAVFTLLTVIHMTGRRKRISGECGLGTKAAPALAAGLAFARGADLPEVMRRMRSVSKTLRGLKCHGARASCGGKAQRALRVVLARAAHR